MKGAFIAMKNTRFSFDDPRLPREEQLKRVRSVMRRELTDRQREILEAVYFDGRTQAELAAERGLSRSTVCRTLHRAVERLQRFLRY